MTNHISLQEPKEANLAYIAVGPKITIDYKDSLPFLPTKRTFTEYKAEVKV